VAEVLDRAVVRSVLQDEPLLEDNTASGGGGVGHLSQGIPAGMRAFTMAIKDVDSAAGLVMPGVRVDVRVVGRPPGSRDKNSNSVTVLRRLLVLSAGSPNATLLVTPDQAEFLTWAGAKGRIQVSLSDKGVLASEADR